MNVPQCTQVHLCFATYEYVLWTPYSLWCKCWHKPWMTMMKSLRALFPCWILVLSIMQFHVWYLALIQADCHSNGLTPVPCTTIHFQHDLCNGCELGGWSWKYFTVSCFVVFTSHSVVSCSGHSVYIETALCLYAYMCVQCTAYYKSPSFVWNS